jgi:hypothetical protein
LRRESFICLRCSDLQLASFGQRLASNAVKSGEGKMNTVLGILKGLTNRLAANARVRFGVLSIVAALLIFQLYFVRELLAAELLFAMGFAALFFLGGLLYLIGAISERGFDWTEAGVRVIASSARRGYATLEEISRKPFRHPRSESAQ